MGLVVLPSVAGDGDDVADGWVEGDDGGDDGDNDDVGGGADAELFTTG